MTEITVKRSVQVEETVEVTFPLYFESEYVSDSSAHSSWSIWRIAEDGRTVDVTVERYGSSVEKHEIAVEQTSRAEIGSMLQGSYSRPSTAAEFDKALAEARAELEKALA